MIDTQLLAFIPQALTLLKSESVQNVLKEAVKASSAQLGKKATDATLSESAKAVKAGLSNVKTSLRLLFGRNSEAVTQMDSLESINNNPENQAMFLNNIEQSLSKLDLNDESMQADLASFQKTLQDLENTTNQLKLALSNGPTFHAHDAGIIASGTVHGPVTSIKSQGNTTYTVNQTINEKKKVEFTPSFTSVPPLPPGFFPQPQKLDSLKQQILAASTKGVALSGTLQGIGMDGQGGIGKTILATALGHDSDIRNHFFDGIFWLTLGQTPIITAKQQELANKLFKTADFQISFQDAQEGTSFLQEHLQQKQCLIILDDIWSIEHLKPFELLSFPGQILVTTRKATVISQAGFQENNLDLMTDDEALAFLATTVQKSRETLPSEAKDIIEGCGNLILALSEVGKALRGKPDNRWSVILYNLNHSMLTQLLRPTEVSVQELSYALQEAYLDFAIFPEDTPIPRSVLEQLWHHKYQWDEYQTIEALDQFTDSSLMRRDEQERYFIHDLQQDFVRVALGKERLAAYHVDFIQSCSNVCQGNWHQLPNNGYLFEHLCKHYFEAGDINGLKSLLTDFHWLQAKLEATDINALREDYRFMTTENAFNSIEKALQLSQHILREEGKTQLASQLIGRLLIEKDQILTDFLQDIRQKQTNGWIEPLNQCFSPIDSALIQTLKGHLGWVTSVALSANGRIALSGSWDRTLKVWDLTTGTCTQTLQGHSHGVTSVALSADGYLALSGSIDHTLKVWDLTTGTCTHTLQGHLNWVTCVTLSMDGSTILSGSDDGALKIWDLNTGICLYTLRGHSDGITSIALSADSRTMLSGSWDRTLKVWDLTTGTCTHTLQGHSTGVTSVALSADGRIALSGSNDRTIKIWDLTTHTCKNILQGHSGRITHIVFIKDSSTALSSSSDRTIKIWNLISGTCEHTLHGHTGRVTSITLPTDGHFALSGSYDHTLQVWNLTTTPGTDPLQKHSKGINSIALSADGRIALSGSSDRTLKTWGLALNTCENTLQGHLGRIISATLSTDGYTALSGSIDRTLKVWDLTTGTCTQTLQGHSHGVTSVALSLDGSIALSGSDDCTLKVWDLTTGTCVKTLQGHSKCINSIALSTNGHFVLSGSSDRTLKVWDLTTGTCVKTLQGHSKGVNSIALSTDGHFALSGSDDCTIKVWDLTTGTCVKTLQGHSDRINSIALSLDSRFVLSGSYDRILKAWDLLTEQAFCSFVSDAPINSCAISNNTSLILAGNSLGYMHFLKLHR